MVKTIFTEYSSKVGKLMKGLYIFFCIIFTVAGQIFVKKGAIGARDATSILGYLTNFYIILGFLMAAVAAVAWVKALQHFTLSHAYPFMSLSFPIVAFLSVIIFNEVMKLNQWIGLLIVLLGLYIGSK